MAKVFHNSNVPRKTQLGPIQRPEPLPPRFNRLNPKFNFRPISPKPATFDPNKPRLIDQFINRDENYWRNRVTIKMDVSFSEHSYIIGRQGKNTQEVMKKTGCHIHFPDCNRDPNMEKSNQVSVAGPMRTVEEARLALRSLAPLSLSFVVRNRQAQLYEEHPVVQEILQQFPVAVLIRSDKILGCPQVIVRGSHYQMAQVRDATLALLGKLFNKKSTVVSTSFEVTQPQQNFLIGADGCNVEAIQAQTGVEIRLPNPYRAETTFNISGTVDGVIQARQMLIGFLPLVMIFELPEHQKNPDIPVLQEQLGVNICIKSKANPEINESTSSVIVKGPECRIGQIFGVRQHFLYDSDSDLNFIEPVDKQNLRIDTGSNRSSISPNQPVPYYSGLSPSSVPFVFSPNAFLTAFETAGRPPSSGYVSAASREPTPVDKSLASPKVPESPLATAIAQSISSKRPTYEDVKVLANKAITNKPNGVPRKVNPEFSGFGFSSSMSAHLLSMAKANPELMAKEIDAEADELADKIGPWRLDTPDVISAIPPRVNLNASAYFDSIPSGPAPITGKEELPELLNNLKLTKYIDLFRENEIDDLDTFATLTEEELLEIGVKADWPRKRMLNAINTLRHLAKQKRP